ncbi:MAG: homoserine O-acetyltransferase [Leptospiraceae bacterium]|nr:homoserine O-acetyltransferase [Leptospiraceae bacterium]MDW8307106.1 homoserine O-acetyltransferase [Leptospiraceae bacterium]
MEDKEPGGSVGIVEPKYFSFDKLVLESGAELSPVTICYETYGKLNESKSNAILICHAFSGDAHAAGFHRGEKKPGWWDMMIGPGKAFDTNRFFVICSNVIGGCAGSTGPSSINPATGRRYALDFPLISIGDMVAAQERLISYLGIDKLFCVAGGSMGGMQTLQWVKAFPERVRSAIPIATCARHSPQQIAFNEVGRQAVMADPNWNHGNYYEAEPPARGLAVARMIGHITYMSDKSMAEKFGRRMKEKSDGFKFAVDFEVEGYLRYRGDSFVRRFDANSYLYITKAMDLFDLAGDRPLHEVFRGKDVRMLVISYKSDWLYPSYQSQEIVRACKVAGMECSYVEIESTYGHDAFLLETERSEKLIKHFLESEYSEVAGYSLK